MMLLSAEVLEQAFEHLRRCGAGRSECVVYLTGPLEAPNLVDGVAHPSHTAGPGRYDVSSDSIAKLWSELVKAQRSIRVQVHTHPGATYHSSRDDELALIHTPGFLSLVIPHFGLGPVGFEGAFLAERTDDGRWTDVAIRERLAVAP